MCICHLQHLPDIIILPFWHKSIPIAYGCDFTVDYFFAEFTYNKTFQFLFPTFTQYSHNIDTQLHAIYNI